jgi:hypothetical protein
MRSAARLAASKAPGPSPSYTNTMSRSDANDSSSPPSFPNPITAMGTGDPAAARAWAMRPSATAAKFRPTSGTFVSPDA